MELARWLSEGWKIYGRFRLLLIVGCLILVAYELSLTLAVPRTVSGAADTGQPVPGPWLVLAVLLSLVLSPLLYTGYQYLALEAARGRAEIARMGKPFKRPLPVLGAVWGSALIAGLGLFLLVVPGIIWYLKFMFAPLRAVDRNTGPLDSLRESGEMTAGHKWQLFGMEAVFFLLEFPLTYLVSMTSQGYLPWAMILLVVVQLIISPWRAAAHAAAYLELGEPAREEGTSNMII